MRKILLGLCVAITAAVGCASPVMAEPDAIKVPAGNKKISTMSAIGVQTYRCAGGVWTFVQPDAVLNNKGQPAVLHSAGPIWIAVKDNSAVTGGLVASTPRANAIPELLLKSTSNRGKGELGTVTFIQRLNTEGGLAPTGKCVDGKRQSVPYTADYTFWVKG